jgi:hypothetical protein
MRRDGKFKGRAGRFMLAEAGLRRPLHPAGSTGYRSLENPGPYLATGSAKRLA